MTILQKLATLSRVLDVDTDNLKHINMACSFFINTLPQPFAVDLYIESEVEAAGIKCGLKYASVVRNGIPCRRIPANLKRRISDATSEYAATVTDPVFYKEQGMLYVKPDPTVDEKAYVSKIPTSFLPDDAEPSVEVIPNIPEEAENIVLLYTAFLIVSNKFRSITFPAFPVFDDTANTLAISFPAIGDVTINTSLSFTALDALSYSDVTDTEFKVDSSEITKGLSALENAFKFVGSLTESGGDYSPTGVPTGAFWLDDEDPEMVQSASQLAAQEVNRANSYFGNRSTGLNSYRTFVDGKVAEFQSKAQVEIQKLNARIQQMSAKAQANQSVLEKHGLTIQEVNTQLQKFQVDVSQRLQKNQQLLERFSQSLQSYQLEYSTFAQEAVSLYERYRMEMSNYLGVNESQ